jgi:hypothetical protein
MKSGLSYLIAARQCEISELERLAHTSELVGLVGRFTHALQRERGITNIVLASHGARFADHREPQVAQCMHVEADVRASFEALETDPSQVRNGARLFSRIAVVLHELEALPGLRHDIAVGRISARQATASYVRLIAGLLSVVFEAADSAGDPEISRALVAMFHFMQGKEFAGQERALGAAMFASARADADSRQHWRHLVEQQNACFQVFVDFSDAAVLAADRASHDERTLGQLERMRHVGASLGEEDAIDASLAHLWYDCCTQRIDAMRSVEDFLATHLRRLCERKIGEAREELRDQQAIAETLHRAAGARNEGAPMPLGPQLERSVLDMVQEQSARLQSMSDELDKVRGALNERKAVERAKGLLMAHRQLSEEDAYRAMRQMAMNQKRRLVDVAEAILAMADVLPGVPR